MTSKARRAGTSGSPAISARATSDQRRRSARAASMAGWARSSASASACSASSVRPSCDSSSRNRASPAAGGPATGGPATGGEVTGGPGAGGASACSTGRLRTPSRRSVPGALPDCAESLATSRMSSDSWNATPRACEAAVILATTSAGAPANIAPNLPAVAMSDAVLSSTTRR